jgi:hypothetical protein
MGHHLFVCTPRKIPDGYALHCYHMALEGEFSFTAEVPGDKWGGVWDCVREQIQRRGFEGWWGGCLGGVRVEGNG